MNHYKQTIFSSSLALLLVLLIFTLSDTVRARIQNQASLSDESEFSESKATSFLSGPSDGDPLDIAMSYILDNKAAWGLNEEDLSDIAVTDMYSSDHTGTTHIYLMQRYDGREIHGANLNINIAADGSVINVSSSFVGNLADSVEGDLPQITAQEAVQVSAESAGLTLSEPLNVKSYLTGESTGVVFDGTGFALEPVPANLVYVVFEDSVRLAWNTEIYELNALHFWSTYVDAQDGKVLSQADRVVHDNWSPPPEQTNIITIETRRTLDINSFDIDFTSALTGTYRVYPIPVESPSHTVASPPQYGRSLVVEPALAAASPFGWHDTNGIEGAEYSVTRGNNVHAYTDLFNNNTPDSGSEPDGGAGLLFDLALDLSQEPSAYRPAAVTNLFYWNNIMHDVSYLYGFDEAAGNFQQNNYGKGGQDSDYVRAEAQDSAGRTPTLENRNNANFVTPPDGSRPRMQMYIWTLTSPMRDGDLDNGVIAHEYGHGISNRLVGGPSNASCLFNSEQMGEGWSDWQSMIMTMSQGENGAIGRGVGSYALGQTPPDVGIRPARYSTNMAVNGYTYGDLDAPLINIPHGVGFIWNTMLWELLWDLIDEYGFNPDIHGSWQTGGNNLAHQLVTDGMKLVNCSPGFVDARNAILSADQVLTGGRNQCLLWEAFAKRGLGHGANQGNINTVGDEFESFELPPYCSDWPILVLSPASASTVLKLDQQVTGTLTISNTGSLTLTWSISESEPLQLSLQNSEYDGSISESTASVEMILDDDSIDTSIGNVGEFVWFNRFTPNSSEYPFVLSEVWVKFPASISVGDEIEIVVHEDLDGDSNPGTGAIQRGTFTSDIQFADNSTWSKYPLSPSIVLDKPGDVLIGVVNRYNRTAASGDFPASLDEASSNGRSWAGYDSSGAIPDPVVYPTEFWGTIDSFGFPGNWLIRGYGQTICSDLSDIGWLSVNPTSGDILPSSIQDIELTYDSTGLVVGEYQAELCIGSNDQYNPLQTMPVTLTVTNIDAPNGLTAMAGDGIVELDWNDITEIDLAGYNLFRGLVSGGPYVKIESDLENTIYTDTNVVNGTTYYYVVTAVDDLDLESPYSNEVLATPMAPPEDNEHYLPMIFK